MTTCDDDWEQFLLSDTIHTNEEPIFIPENRDNKNKKIPKCSDIYISTKTKISYLSEMIDLNNDFWKISIIDYNQPIEGVVKKQIKINSKSTEEVEFINNKLKHEQIYHNQVISSINNPDNNKIKFKDVRKITIGLSKKDITSHRCKEKSAFYNCFVLIIRLKVEDGFKECHAKIFNTGKIELPGIQSEEILERLLKYIVNILKKECHYKDITYMPEKTETVLINSNFNCGFYINRDTLYDTLRNKYRLHTLYDPCSYPGIMSKFYYNTRLDKNLQTGIKSEGESEKVISFMIFRTGSVLIVGKCIEDELIQIYKFLKNMLESEYENISQGCFDEENFNIKPKNKNSKKIRRKINVLDNF